MTGDLPIRASVMKVPGYKQFVKKYPGVGVWVQNLDNATQARPVTHHLPEDLDGGRQAVQAVLLGKAQPQQALQQAAQQVERHPRGAELVTPGEAMSAIRGRSERSSYRRRPGLLKRHRSLRARGRLGVRDPGGRS